MAIPFCHELVPVSIEFCQAVTQCIWFMGLENFLGRFNITGDYGRIDGISFGACLYRACKVANLQRVQIMHGKARCCQAISCRTFISTRSFQPDTIDLDAFELCNQLDQPGSAIVYTEPFTDRMHVNIQSQLGNVDANILKICYHLLAPWLVIRALWP